jgi:CDP-6-deoxy-D-xylo-4-hexulose-3-dehydrase
MIERERIKEQIKNLIKEYFSLQPKKLISGKTKIPLSVPSYDWEEAYEAIESLLSTSVTMGEKVREFERKFAEYIGVRYNVMVNSGSSANLLALSVLANPTLKKRIRPCDEIIAPAVAWSTTIFPIVNIGAIPVLVDVDLETYDINVDQLEDAITSRTKAIMLVHLLGNPCNMKRIMETAEDNNLFVVEDACEAHGAEFDGRKVGSFGDLSTFSFFFSHHISTIEGGMILTDNEDYAELARSLRAHGWIRELKNRDKIAQKYSGIDQRFLFINMGFNVRPTEIQGGFGIHQIQKLDSFIEARRKNAEYWTKELEEYSDYILLPTERENTKNVWFGYPIIVKPSAPFNRTELTNYLESKSIETRPIMAGNMSEQPAMSLFKYREASDLKNARIIMRQAFFFGNHHAIGQEEREYIVSCFREFMQEKIG